MSEGMNDDYVFITIDKRVKKAGVGRVLYFKEFNLDDIASYCTKSIGITGVALYAYMFEQFKNYIKQDENRVQILKNLKYNEYLKTREWRIKRQFVVRIYSKCQLCGKEYPSYHVHHNNYKNYPLEEITDLTVLCEYCHEQYHRDQNLIKQYATAALSWSTL